MIIKSVHKLVVLVCATVWLLITTVSLAHTNCTLLLQRPVLTSAAQLNTVTTKSVHGPCLMLNMLSHTSFFFYKFSTNSL